MAMPDENEFLSRMRRLEQLRSNTKLTGPALTIAFIKSEAEVLEKDDRPFSVRHAKQFLDTYSEVMFRKGGYEPLASELSISNVVKLMEEPWFKDSTSPDESAIAVQTLFIEMERIDPAFEFVPEELT